MTSQNNANYPREKLYMAMLCLVGDQGIRDRLTRAGLALVVIPSNTVPDEFRDELEAIVGVLTAEKAEVQDEGTLNATIRAMSFEQCGKAAERIFDFYRAVNGVRL